jgi:Mg2+-importing ATPase
MLTGESLPIDKHAGPSDTIATGADDSAFVFLGTSVVGGTGRAAALATGCTLFGDIAKRLGARAPDSEFEHGLPRFSLLILRTTIALVLFILVIALALRRDFIELLLFAVALGVALMPELLSMIASVTPLSYLALVEIVKRTVVPYRVAGSASGAVLKERSRGGLRNFPRAVK